MQIPAEDRNEAGRSQRVDRSVIGHLPAVGADLPAGSHIADCVDVRNRTSALWV
jgi:hypothetical protein